MGVLRTAMFFVAIFMAVGSFAQQSARDYQAQIEELNKDMVKSVMAGEFNENLYAEDAISLPSNEPMHEGIAEIRKANEDMAKTGIKISEFEPKILKVIPEGNLITEIGSYRMKFTMPGMEEPMEDRGKYLTIWEKQTDGSLKIKVETWNSDVNPMDPKQEK